MILFITFTITYLSPTKNGLSKSPGIEFATSLLFSSPKGNLDLKIVAFTSKLSLPFLSSRYFFNAIFLVAFSFKAKTISSLASSKDFIFPSSFL